MADKLIKPGPKPHSSGAKQPGNQSTIKGPTYAESTYNPWNRGSKSKSK